MPREIPIFGQSSSLVAQPRSCNGVAGYFSCPPGYGITTDEHGQRWATDPESGNRYALTLDYDGTLCFFDQMRTLALGQS